MKSSIRKGLTFCLVDISSCNTAKPTQHTQPHRVPTTNGYFNTQSYKLTSHNRSMKFTYLATVSTVLAVSNAAAFKFPRQLVTGNFQLHCNGTSGASAAKHGGPLLRRGKIVMPAPATWKMATALTTLQCLDPRIQCLLERRWLMSRRRIRVSARLPLSPVSRNPQPHTVTTSPGTDATSIPGSYDWKRDNVERDEDLIEAAKIHVSHTRSRHSFVGTFTLPHRTGILNLTPRRQPRLRCNSLLVVTYGNEE